MSEKFVIRPIGAVQPISAEINAYSLNVSLLITVTGVMNSDLAHLGLGEHLKMLHNQIIFHFEF